MSETCIAPPSPFVDMDDEPIWHLLDAEDNIQGVTTGFLSETIHFTFPPERPDFTAVAVEGDDGQRYTFNASTLVPRWGDTFSFHRDFHWP